MDINRVLEKYRTLERKYADIPMSSERRARLYDCLMTEAVEFCAMTESINGRLYENNN